MVNNQIDYLELKANDLKEIKIFYMTCFGWEFTDFGPDYTSFSDGRLNGGFEKTENEITNGTLIVLYHEDLESTSRRIIEAGGDISKAIFSFPGGKRFHFRDPSGNELAVWSDQ